MPMETIKVPEVLEDNAANALMLALESLDSKHRDEVIKGFIQTVRLADLACEYLSPALVRLPWCEGDPRFGYEIPGPCSEVADWLTDDEEDEETVEELSPLGADDE